MYEVQNLRMGWEGGAGSQSRVNSRVVSREESMAIGSESRSGAFTSQDRPQDRGLMARKARLERAARLLGRRQEEGRIGGEL
jgi:hypothetical protein